MINEGVEIEGRLAGTVGEILEDKIDGNCRSAANGDTRFPRIVHSDLLPALSEIDLPDFIGSAALRDQVGLGPTVTVIVEGHAPPVSGSVLQPHCQGDVMTFPLCSR